MINKTYLINEIIKSLEVLHQDAFDAAMRAYDTATNEESEAENKYDTLGLEASYLAQGQSKRVTECEADLNIFKNFKITQSDSLISIGIGSVIYMLDEDDKALIIFLGPAAGGLNIKLDDSIITIITPSSPLGKILVGHSVDDEVELKLGHTNKHYTITNAF